MAVLSARLGLPVAQALPGRLLAWLMGGFVYAAMVTLAVLMAADRAMLALDERPQLVTVALPVARDADLEAALAVLRREDAVLDATPLTDEELGALMTPWLGDTEAGELPWPALIDVRVDPRAEPDMASLQRALGEAVAGATLTVEPSAAGRLRPPLALVRGWSGALLGLALPAALAAIAAVTWLGLRACRDAVDLLRQMGASPAYQAAQVERHAIACSLRGGVCGFVLALATVAALLYSLRPIMLADAIEVGLRPLDWGLLTGLAATGLLLAVGVVRATACWQLREPG